MPEEEKKKYPIPRAQLATRAKNKHRNANYDRGELCNAQRHESRSAESGEAGGTIL